MSPVKLLPLSPVRTTDPDPKLDIGSLTPFPDPVS